MKRFVRKAVESVPPLANFLRSMRDQLDRSQKALPTPWGFTLAGNQEMAKGTFEIEETGIVRSLLENCDVFINVGANVGYYCCHALSLGKPVVAIEPLPRNLHYLMRNIRENGWSKQAEIFPVALGSNTDILEIWGGDTGASIIKGWSGNPDSYVTSVPVLTLDRIIQDRFAGKRLFILADIEGAEILMLGGASKVLDMTPRPNWMVEIAAYRMPDGTSDTHFEDAFKPFLSRGYRARTANAALEEVRSEDVHSEPWAKRQIYNFVFD